MLANDFLRRFRYALNLRNREMIELFQMGGISLDELKLTSYLKKEEEEGYEKCSLRELDCFLDGLILKKRGKKEGAEIQEPPKKQKINNNSLFKKLRIALTLRDEDILAILKLAGIELSKTELSAFFRKEGHPNYKECKDQILRNFLKGLSEKYR